MAILDSPEILDTTSSSADNGAAHHATLRRRPSVVSVPPAQVSNSNSLEAEGAIADSESDRHGADLIGNLRGEGEDKKQDGELSYDKEEEEGEEVKVKENGESSNGNGTEAKAAKFSFRAAAPAHRKNKESPLSSDAIFKQVDYRSTSSRLCYVRCMNILAFMNIYA